MSKHQHMQSMKYELPLGFDAPLCKHECQENGNHSRAEVLEGMPADNMMSPLINNFVSSLFHLSQEIENWNNRCECKIKHSDNR